MRRVEAKLCSLLRRLHAVGVRWYKQRFWNNLKPGRRSASGRQRVLVCGGTCDTGHRPLPPSTALGSLCCGGTAARGCPSPTRSLERRLFPACICWHQLSALGTERAGGAVKRAHRPLGSPPAAHGREGPGDRAGSHFLVTCQSLSQPICSQK